MPSYLRVKKGILSDLVIHWPNNRRRLRSVLKRGRCPSHIIPHEVRVPGGRVVLADSGGTPLLEFVLSHIENGVAITGPEGVRDSDGCELVAKKGSVRFVVGGLPGTVAVNTHGVGQFFYIDPNSGRLRIYGKPQRSRTTRLSSRRLLIGPRDVSHRFLANNIGRTLSQPERDLIDEYGRWIRHSDRLRHYYLRSPRLYTDFVVRSKWVLFEAKALCTREDIREALGQLFDYQRYFARHPSLAMLLPCKPHNDMVTLCRTKRIAVVWRSVGGSFRDSVDGALTSRLRNENRR